MNLERLQAPSILAGIGLAVVARWKEISWLWLPAIVLMVLGVSIRNLRMTSR